MKKLLLSLLLVPLVAFSAGSPNLDIGTVNLLLTNYQLMSEKGAANGYAPLNSGTTVPGANLFPGFSGASDGTIWSKSGTTFVAVTGYTFNTTDMTINTVKIGLLGGSNYGITETNSSRPLVIQGGSSINRVFVANGQTFGGANSGYSGFSWSIGPSGSFTLLGGSFGGDVDMNSNDITEVNSIASAGGTEFDLGAGTIELPSNTSLSIIASSGYGVEVPDSTTSTDADFALNRGSANLIYGRLASNNTWSGSNSFQNVTIAGTLSLTSQLPVASGGTGASTQSGARSALGLAIGTDVQAFSQRLADIAALGAPSSNYFLVGNGSTWTSLSPSLSRTALGLASSATGDASGLTSGTVADARLGANVTLKDGNNTMSGSNSFTGPVTSTNQVALQINSTPVSITSNGQSVSVAGRSVLSLSSNSTSAASRLFTLSSAVQGQILVISFEGSTGQTCRLVKTAGYNLLQDWEPVDGDSITLVYNTNNEWCEVGRSVSTRSVSANLTSNSIEVDTGVFNIVKITSNNTTPSNRVFTLSDSGSAEKVVNIMFQYSGTDLYTCRLADSGNANLSADWEPQNGDTISLIWTGSGGSWLELSRSNN